MFNDIEYFQLYLDAFLLSNHLLVLCLICG